MLSTIRTDNEFYFPMPQVELRELKPSIRKRKQNITMRDGDREAEIFDIEDIDERVPIIKQAYSIEPEMSGTKRQDQKHLYLLNPEDYAHDPKKQRQIIRAIKTRRFHQDKKEQIIKLTEENKRLRERMEKLKTIAIQLSQCGCEKIKV